MFCCAYTFLAKVFSLFHKATDQVPTHEATHEQKNKKVEGEAAFNISRISVSKRFIWEKMHPVFILGPEDTQHVFWWETLNLNSSVCLWETQRGYICVGAFKTLVPENELWKNPNWNDCRPTNPNCIKNAEESQINLMVLRSAILYYHYYYYNIVPINSVPCLQYSRAH